jgi:tRNA uridine 5-carbamoylmethylation protein Kti12
MRRKGILESMGYDVSMVFVSTSLETSLKRNQQRERKVDEDFLKETYEQMNKLKPYYSSQFRPFLEVNNDVGELTDDVVISAYKKMESFFKSPLKNPIGISLRDELLETGKKYLVEHPDYDMGYINKLVNN